MWAVEVEVLDGCSCELQIGQRPVTGETGVAD
jgi:hypothetical protein